MENNIFVREIKRTQKFDNSNNNQLLIEIYISKQLLTVICTASEYVEITITSKKYIFTIVFKIMGMLWLLHKQKKLNFRFCESLSKQKDFCK
jgi:hypothetical protein